MIFIIGAVICAVAFIAWEALRLLQRRGATARRRERMTKGMAKQKAWDVVFGRRVQRRLSFDPAERAED